MQLFRGLTRSEDIDVLSLIYTNGGAQGTSS